VSSITICAPYDHSKPLTDVTFRVGEPFTFAADVFPVEAQAEAKITWRSTDETVATIDKDGTMNAIGAGTCDIIAECGGVAQKCIVRVR
jgi:uncharacterized protein YjdB